MKRFITVVLVLVFCLFSSSPTLSEVTRVGAVYCPGDWIRDVKVYNNHAFILGYSTYICDLDNTSDNFKLQSPYNSAFWDIYFSNSVAFAVGYHGLTIFNVENIKSPKFVYYMPVKGGRGIAVKENFAFYTGNTGGVDGGFFNVYDVSNPESPVLVESINSLGYILSLKIKYNFAYLTDRDKGLHIFDISNPSNPIDLGIFHTESSKARWRLDVKNGYAYIPQGNLAIVDISDPYYPKLTSILGVPGGVAKDVAVNGKYAFIASGQEGYGKPGFFVADISDPSNPVIVDSFRADFFTYGVEQEGDLGFIADGKMGMKIVNVSDYSEPKDTDNDGIIDDEDNCPETPNAEQDDLDEDGKGDVCDTDIDDDGVLNEDDNCGFVKNEDQADFDQDTIGDACDPDIDDDGVENTSEKCEYTTLGEAVDPLNGCSINQLVPPEGPIGTDEIWKNHGQYVSSVAQTANSFLEQGLITEAEKEAVVEAAAESDIGKK